jgi:hypothetical protein
MRFIDRPISNIRYQKARGEEVALPADPFALAALLLVLGVVGWGFGLSAALARCSVDRLRMPAPGTRMIAVTIAVLLALGTSYAYAVVLDVTGVIDYCDPVRSSINPC